jgi:proline iminopeptidase
MVDQARLWTARTGEGQPLVLCHGGPGRCDNLAPVSALVEDVATVYRFDRRACGRSGGSPGTLARSVADLEGLRRHWGHERWIVGGHSRGASLALAYALAHPARVTGLVLLSAAGLTHERKGDYEDEHPASGDLTGELGNEGDLQDAARRLDAPALVVHGDRDPPPAWPARALARALPRSRFVLLPGAGHLPWLESPGPLGAELRAFLATAGAGDDIAVLRCPACGDTFPTDAARVAPCPTCGGRRAELASEPLL